MPLPTRSGSKVNREEGLPGIASYLNNNGYRMGKVLGEGSYSKVRVCNSYYSDGSLCRKIACKIINKKKASGDFVSKFLPRELQIVTKLQHPNIIHVYDLVEFDDHVYIFMDCCDRGDLLEYIKAKGFINESKGRHYFRQLLSAVRYLHAQDLAHRDLKCENVLLANRDQIRISDFGFARYCRDKSGRRALSNTYCGSAAYAAPEILLGTNYNPKLYDMWSVGCVLFIMLTGHMPFDESNLTKMLDNQMNRVLTYPAPMEGQISHTAKSLIRHLLEPDVTRRANIDQALSHNWLRDAGNSNSRPNSSRGSQATNSAVVCHNPNNRERENSGCGDGNFEVRKSSPVQNQGAGLPQTNISGLRGHQVSNATTNANNIRTQGDGFCQPITRIPVTSSKVGTKNSSMRQPESSINKAANSVVDSRNQVNSSNRETISTSQFDGLNVHKDKEFSNNKVHQPTSGRQQGRTNNSYKYSSGNNQFTFSPQKKSQWR